MKRSFLGVIRLSRETEESTSPVRQRQIIENWADVRGDNIIGWAEDLGVSATVDPWERPELGAWLRGDHGSFDGLACWRLDRVARRVLHFAKLLDWARSQGMEIASATEGFDLSTPIGRMFAQMIAMLAEGELEAIKERTKGSYDHLVSVGRHRGGFQPYGYRSVPKSDGRGFVLEIDPEAKTQLREIARRVVDGESINSIVTSLNAAQIPTSLARQRMQAGKPPHDPKTGKVPSWRVGALSKLLRSDTLLGYLSPESRSGNTYPVDEAGRRVRRAEPILDRSEWDELQTVLLSREGVRGPRERRRAAMLLRIAYCAFETGNGACGTRMYLYTARSEPYYRCGSKGIGGTACGGGSVRTSVLEAVVEDAFLDKVGEKEVLRRVFIGGEDHAGEIREADEALGRLTERLERVPDGPAADAVLARMVEHTQHLAHLRALPQRPAGWHLEGTGQTYNQLWAQLDRAGRGKLLRDTFVRVDVRGTRPLDLSINLGDLEQLEARALDSAAALAV